MNRNINWEKKCDLMFECKFSRGPKLTKKKRISRNQKFPLQPIVFDIRISEYDFNVLGNVMKIVMDDNIVQTQSTRRPLMILALTY